MANPNNKQSLSTLTIQKEDGTETLDIVRYQDGSMDFTKTNDITAVVQSSNIDFKALWDAIDALDA